MEPVTIKRNGQEYLQIKLDLEGGDGLVRGCNGCDFHELGSKEMCKGVKCVVGNDFFVFVNVSKRQNPQDKI
jgi:hypothetical protein